MRTKDGIGIRGELLLIFFYFFFMMADNNISIVLNILKKQYKGKTMLGSFTDKSPFQILIATTLSARSRDEQTIKVVEKLFPLFPTPEKLAKADITLLEKLVKKTGFYHVKARRIKELSQFLLDNHDGIVPDIMDKLVALPGVGRKTAGCVLVYAFGKSAIPVDTHVHRISNRLGWVNTKQPEETEQELLRIVPKQYWTLVNEVFVLHGQNICKPITPYCEVCPVKKYCEHGIEQSQRSI